MTAIAYPPTANRVLPKITWEKLSDDFVLPDDHVNNNLQPLLAEALREPLELAGLFLESMLIATNFGICETVGDKTVVKAPDWVYIPEVKPLSERVVRRAYTRKLQGNLPLIALGLIVLSIILPTHSINKFSFREDFYSQFLFLFCLESQKSFPCLVWQWGTWKSHCSLDVVISE